MRVPKAFKDRVYELVQYFQELISAQEYTVTVLFRKAPKHKVEMEMASIFVDGVYLCATLKITDNLLKEWESGRGQQVVLTICHEMCHVLTEPLYCEALWLDVKSSKSERVKQSLADIRERQTELICKAILKNLPETL